MLGVLRKMPVQFLTDEQRRNYARFDGSPSPDQIARYFHLDFTDHALIQNLRSDHSRLGFALMLCGARFLGAFPDESNDLPGSVLSALSKQLGLESGVTLANYFGSRQRVRHLILIRGTYGFADFALAPRARFRLTRWLYVLCWSGDDRPGPLIERAISWLIANKVLLPGVTVLERFVGRIRDRAQNRLWRRLVAGLRDGQRARISALFDETDPAAFAALDALRTEPSRRTPTEFLHHLDRLEAIRAFDLCPSPPKGVPAATLERLARVARVGKPSAIAALQEPRRTATVAALFHTLEATAQDDAAELAEALLTDLFKDAAAANKDKRLRTLRDLDDAARLLREMGRMVVTDDDFPLVAWREALFEKLPRADIEAAMMEVDAIAEPKDASLYSELRARWRRARRLFFNIATRIDLGSSPNGEALSDAVAYLKGVTDWSNATMRDAPTGAIPKSWRGHVLDEKGVVRDPKAYVLATIAAWRSALKRRDIFATPGIRYGDPRRGLLDGAAWQDSSAMICRALNRSLDAEAEVTGLTRLLDETYARVAARASDNSDLRIEIVEGKSEIVVTPLDRLEEPESLRALRPNVQGRMPKVGLPDVLLEIMTRTGFAQAFSHLSERQAKVDNFEISLCAVLVGQACNIGIEPMVRPDIPALRRDRLSWISQNFVRPENHDAASALIVSAHDRLPIVKHWGDGNIASADGMRFAAPATAIHAGPNPKYFGQGRGVTWYNLVSNQFSGLNAIVVPGTLRDSLVILALLLEQETELKPVEIMTDTAAYSDAVFGLFWLLGYQFSPRLADIGGAKLWRVDANADHGVFGPIARGFVNTKLIIENWPDLIRLAGSLKLGHLKAVGVMRMLQIKDRPTTLARALSELGRMIKTLHILRYIDDPLFRRRILTQLNRQESRHKLGRRVHHGEGGEVKSPLRQGQEEQLGALGLALNAITYWNAIYMQEALRQITTEGASVDNADIARLSPVTWRHINFLGRYEFSLPESVSNGSLRPLRNPNSE
jgi:TnpA family transposase